MYRFLAANAGEVATATGALAAGLAACDPETAEVLARMHLTCDVASRVLVGATAALVWLGLYDMAGAEQGPKVPLEAPR